MKKIYFLLPFIVTTLFSNESDALVKRLKVLEQTNKKQSKLISELYEELDGLDQKLEEVETTTLIDKIKLGLGFRVKMNNFDKTMANGTKISSDNIWSTKFMLTMRANITDKMKFHGRLSMYKYWADSTKHLYAQYDNMQGRVPSDSSVYLERAYIDWYFNLGIPSALTIGRQPSADGPSHQFKENTTRKSTYSALVFDGASDGIVYTADISKLTNIKNAKLRLAYGKGFQNDETQIGVSNAFIGSQNDTLKDTNVAGAFFESNIPGTNNSLFQIGYVQMNNVIANAMETDTDKNQNIGDISFVGIMAEATNFKESNFDLFAHYGISTAKPNKNLYQYNGYSFGLLRDSASDSTTNKTGEAFWIGARYTFDNFYGIKAGAEYNYGSKYWVTATQGSYDVYNKLATRGNAIEIYSLYPINRYSFIKLGVLNINYDYTYSGWYQKAPKKISDLPKDEKTDILEKLRSIYLQFSVRF
jgi:hypothetical protein